MTTVNISSGRALGLAVANREAAAPRLNGGQRQNAPGGSSAPATFAGPESAIEAKVSAQRNAQQANAETREKAKKDEKKKVELEPVFSQFLSGQLKLSISEDSGSGRFVYRGIDPKSGEVVSQFPAEELLAFLKAVKERPGLVLDAEA